MHWIACNHVHVASRQTDRTSCTQPHRRQLRKLVLPRARATSASASWHRPREGELTRHRHRYINTAPSGRPCKRHHNFKLPCYQHSVDPVIPVRQRQRPGMQMEQSKTKTGHFIVFFRLKPPNFSWMICSLLSKGKWGSSWRPAS